MSRSLDTWLTKLTDDPFLRTNGLPHLLEKWIGHRIVTQQEFQSIKEMLLSPDQENWIIALSIMKSKAKKKK